MRSEQDNIELFIRNAKLRLILRDFFHSALVVSLILLSAILFAPLFQKVLKELFPLSLKIVFLLVFIVFVLRVTISFSSVLSKKKFYQALKRFFPSDITDEIYSAEELLRTMRSQSEPLFAKELANAHIKRVEDNFIRMNKIPIFSSESRSSVRVALILTLFIIFIDAFSGAYRNTLSALYRLVPSGSDKIVNSIDINYIYPAYTNLPSVWLKNTDGNIRALKGTTAELNVFLRITPDKCDIVMDDGGRFPLQNEQKFFYGSIIVETDRTYYIECQQGKKYLRDMTARSIAVEEDEFPKIDAQLMKSQEVISPDENILFFYSASDDFGLKMISFFCESTSGEKYNTTVKQLPLISKSINGEFLWKTSEMALKKGREVTCYFSAFDNDTISGQKEGRSQVFHFRVGALDTRERLLEDIGALFEGFVSVLADVLERHEGNINLSFITNLKRTISELKIKGRDILKSLAERQGKITELLNNVVNSSEDILVELQRIQTGGTVIAKKGIESITGKLEETVLSLYTLIKLGRYELLMNTAEDILSYQQSLLNEFKSGKAGEIYKKIEEMEKALVEMFSGLASTGGSFSEEFINIDALKRMGSMSLFDKLSRIKSLLQQGKIKEAEKLYEEFMSEYAKVLASMQEFLNNTTLKEFSEFMKKLSEVQSEVKKLTSGEAKITSALKNLQPRIGYEIHEWLRKELEKVNELLNKIDFIEKREELMNQQDLKEARRRAELIKISLSAVQLFDALQEAKATLGSLEKLQFLPGVTKDETVKSELNSAITLNREIINDIEKILKNLSAGLDEKSKQKLQSLAREQEGIEKRTRELYSEFQKSQSNNELMKTPIPDMLSGAADFMKGAKMRMENSDAPGGLQNASEALKQLGKIDDYIEEMKSGHGMPMPVPLFGYRQYGSGYGSSTGRVELPGEQESAYQKEIKEELLRAIRGGLPEELEEENRKYIKELMK
jgi:hypothetical protein